MAKIKIKGLYTEVAQTPIYGQYTFTFLTKYANFMTDPRFNPNKQYFETFSSISGYTQDEWSISYRSKRNLYSNTWTKALVFGFERYRFEPSMSAYYSVVQHNYTNNVNIIIKGLIEHPYGVSVYDNGPLLDFEIKHRLPIIDHAKIVSERYLYNLYPNIILENGESEFHPIITQYESDLNDCNRYFDLNFKSLNSDLTQEEEDDLLLVKSGCTNLLTSENYYLDIWNDGALYASCFWDISELSLYSANTSCQQALGDIDDIIFENYVNRKRDLPESLNDGHVIIYKDELANEKNYYAFDKINNEFSSDYFKAFVEPLYLYQRIFRDAKMKVTNEFLLTLRPFIFAANYLPSYKIKKDLI